MQLWDTGTQIDLCSSLKLFILTCLCLFKFILHLLLLPGSFNQLLFILLLDIVLEFSIKWGQEWFVYPGPVGLLVVIVSGTYTVKVRHVLEFIKCTIAVIWVGVKLGLPTFAVFVLAYHSEFLFAYTAWLLSLLLLLLLACLSLFYFSEFCRVKEPSLFHEFSKDNVD